jgi:hypothetical protein
MIRPALTEIGIFLIPFGVYALFLIATRGGLAVQSSWPIQLVAKLALGALCLRIFPALRRIRLTFLPISRTAGWFPESRNENRARAGRRALAQIRSGCPRA